MLMSKLKLEIEQHHLVAMSKLGLDNKQ